MIMKLTSAAVMVLALSVSTASWAQSARDDVRGEVVSVDAENATITIRSSDGVDTFDVDSTTELTFEDRRGNSLDDIGRGDRVLLNFEESTDGRKRARTIRDDKDDQRMAQTTTNNDDRSQTNMSQVPSRQDSMDSTLPKTASSNYNLLFFGLTLMLLAGFSRLVRIRIR